MKHNSLIAEMLLFLQKNSTPDWRAVMMINYLSRNLLKGSASFSL